MQNSELFSPLRLGSLELPHRIAMAPLTRCRAGQGNVPTSMNATYYAQRASASLIVSEATQVTALGVGYPNTPGIHSEEQVEGWKRVTSAVHGKGGRVFLQLWHVGRISHPDLLPEGELPVAPSAVAPAGTVQTLSGPKPYVTPRPLRSDEIPGVIEQFRNGALNAKRAGFDGVEIHNANGYLLDQFLRDGTNRRTDEWGGTVQKRARLTLEVTKAVVSVWGSDRVGVRLSPNGTFNDMSDSNPESTFRYLMGELSLLGLAYMHVIEQLEGDARHGGKLIPLSAFRSWYRGTLMTNGGHTLESAQGVISEGLADLVAFGKPFIANPDLPERFRRNAPLNTPDFSTFYGGGERGYTDYPALTSEGKQ